MRVLFILFVFVACKIEVKPEDYDDEILACSLDYKYPKVNTYYQPKQGFSCKELNERISRPLDTCDVSMVVGSSNSRSERNTIIPGVDEPRKLIHNMDYTFHASDGEINIYKDDKKVNVLHIDSIHNQLLFYKNLLVVKGHEKEKGENHFKHTIKIYSVVTINNIKKIKEYHFEKINKLFLKENKLKIISSSYEEMYDEIRCKEIFYADNSSNLPLTTLNSIDLTKDDFSLRREKEIYGYWKVHEDIDSTYLYKQIYTGSFTSSETLLLKENDHSFNQVTLDGVITSRLSLKEVKENTMILLQKNNTAEFLILNNELKNLSRISNIAPDERVTAARFKGTRFT